MATVTRSGAQHIAEQFRLEGRIVELCPYGHGLINDTFRITTSELRRYILQRLNPRVFHQPELVLANLRTLLDHAKGRSGAGLQLPELLRTREQGDAVVDHEGNYWRLLTYIENSRSLEAPGSSAATVTTGILKAGGLRGGATSRSLILFR